MGERWSVRLLCAVGWMMIGILALFALYALSLLTVALFLPAFWPRDFTLTTAIPGFNLPTVALWTRLIFVGRTLGTLALTALVIVPIAGIARSMRTGSPFTSANVRRLYLVAAGCALCGFGPLLLPWILPIDAKIPLGLLYGRLNWQAAALAMVVLVLAEIFREGIRLRDDVDATI